MLAEIKCDPSLRRIPVIILTSSGAPGDIARAYELQATGYFVKPVTGFDEVVASIYRFLSAAELPVKAQESLAAGAASIRRPTSADPALCGVRGPRMTLTTARAGAPQRPLIAAHGCAVVSVRLGAARKGSQGSRGRIAGGVAEVASGGLNREPDPAFGERAVVTSRPARRALCL